MTAAECEFFSTTSMTVLKNKKCGTVRSNLVNYGGKIGQLKSDAELSYTKIAGDRVFFLKLQIVAECDGFSTTTWMTERRCSITDNYLL